MQSIAYGTSCSNFTVWHDQPRTNVRERRGGYIDMKKSCMFLLVFFGLITLLIAPGIVLAFDSGYGNMVIIPNTGGAEGPDWGPNVPIDGHGDSNVFAQPSNPPYANPPQVYTGMVMTWLGNASTLPSGVSFGAPFYGASVTPSLSNFLTSYGSHVNDLAMIGMGISVIYPVSEPVKNLLPFATQSAPSPPYEAPYYQGLMWNTTSTLWNIPGSPYQYPVVIIQEQTNTLSGLPGTYTPYTPVNDTYPGWDPTVLTPAQNVADYPWPTCPTGQCQGGQDGKPIDYINPALWTQWTYEIQNDVPSVPEPSLLLLLGSGVVALAGMRRMIKK